MFDPTLGDVTLRLLEQLPVGVLLYRLEDASSDESLKVVGFNAAAERMLGVPLEPKLGVKIRAAFPNVLPERVAVYADLARRGGSVDLGQSVYGDDAVTRSVFLLRAAGLGSGTVALFIESATELKRLSMFLDAIIENLPNMVFVKEAKALRFERFNRAGEELLGLTRDQLLGKNDYDFFPKDQADFFQERDRAALNGTVVIDIPEEPIQTSRGQRWLHTRKVPLHDAAGHPQYLLGISEDITDRKLADEKMRKLLEKLEESNAELDGFTYSVSHDLRAPLRAIDGYARVLLEDHGAELGEEGRRVAGVITKSAVKMGRLIDDLLGFARLGRKALTRSKVDMHGLAEDAFDECRPEGRKVELTLGPLPPALGDAALLKQVWVNLLSNAVKYSRARDPAKIDVSGEQRGGECVYQVKDNGVGFDPRYQDKLFGVFQRLHTDTEYEGTGVGLALVQRVVHRHGGWVKAQSTLGQGATFSFGLPAPIDKEPSP